MGSSFSLPIDCMATKCWDVCIGDQRSKYVRDLPKNLQSLKNLSADLSAQKADILRKVEAAEQFQNRRRLDTVGSWLTTVTTEEEKVASLIQDSSREIQKLCFGGCCSKNCISSYKFGKKVAQQIDTVKVLLAKTKEEDFKSLIDPQQLNQVDLIPMESPIGLDSTFDRAWGCIHNEDVGIIGLYGPGGVGKTTLLKQIHNKFCDSTDFVVIWVVVSKGCNPEKLQEDIGKSIGFSDDSWKKSYDEKAKDILRILGRKKFALFLDDIWDWEHVNPIQMGIPSKLNGSKIIFTTRSLEVCGQMEANETISVKYLKTREAFELFRKKVGENTLASDPKILELAKRVANECAGLPLALITVARAMREKKTPQQWELAIEVLRKNESKFPTMTEKVYSHLKFIYDHLPDKMVQSCFLYCCLFPDDCGIRKSDLIEYWNCEGFLGEKSEKYNRNRGFDIIGTLLNACLLEKHEVEYVKMHGVTRDMALWIAQEVEKDEHGFFVRAGSMLREVPQVEEWKGARRVSLMHNNIQQLQEVPSCSNLLTLFLNNNNLKMINSWFFQSMPSLVALDLQENRNLVELPSEISNLVCLEYLNLSSTGLRELPIGLNDLVCLEYLNLSRTSLRELPIGLNALVRLKYLNLEWTGLRHIPCNLISNFPKLQTLKMYRSINLKEEGSSEDTRLFFKELQSLEYLNTLTININSNTAFHEFQKSKKLQSCTLQLSLSNIKEEVRVSILLNMKRLELLEMKRCTNIVDDIELDIERVRGDNEGMKLVDSTICANSLEYVWIGRCTNFVDLTWLINAPNLTSIRVYNCNELEEVISMEKLGEGQNLNMFTKLEVLALWNLPKLKSICKYALSFPCLKELGVRECKELKKLPVNLNTSKNNKFTIEGKRDWWTDLEWEDEATEAAFRNSFKEERW